MKKLELSVTKENGLDIIRYELLGNEEYDERIADKVSQLTNVLPFQFDNREGKRIITTYVRDNYSLEMLLSKTLQKREVLCLLGELVSVFDMGAQGIPVSYVVKNPEYIYVNEETLRVKCILVPVKQEAIALSEIPEFFRKIVSRMSFDEIDMDNYVAKLLTIINSKDFSTLKLKNYIDDELEKMGLYISKENGLTSVNAGGDAGQTKSVKVNRLGVMNNMQSSRPQQFGQPPMMGQPMQGQPPMMGQPQPNSGMQTQRFGQPPQQFGMPNQSPMMGQLAQNPGQPPMMGQPAQNPGQPPMMGQPAQNPGQPPMMGQPVQNPSQPPQQQFGQTQQLHAQPGPKPGEPSMMGQPAPKPGIPPMMEKQMQNPGMPPQQQFGQPGPKPGEPSMMGQPAPKQGIPPMMGQPAPKPGIPPMMGQPAQNPGQPPVMGQPAQNPGQPPMMGQPAPKPGIPPMMGQPAPKPGIPPMMGQPAPKPGIPPMMGQPAPKPGIPPMMGQQPIEPKADVLSESKEESEQEPKEESSVETPQGSNEEPANVSDNIPEAKTIPEEKASDVKSVVADAHPTQELTEPFKPESSNNPVPQEQPAQQPIPPQAAPSPIMGGLVGQLNEKPVPHLVRVKTGEIINITKPEFSIGKSESKADYTITDNTAVSRVHCIIIQKNGVNYIKDNNSTNHTYLNGVELEPDKEVLLKNKTTVRMGDEEFTFLLRKE